MDLEKKPMAEQNWAQFKTYVSNIYQDIKRYAKSMNKRNRFAEQANNVEERKREDEYVANIFVVMQESHHEQVNAIRESNAMVMQMVQMQMKTMAEQQ